MKNIILNSIIFAFSVSNSWSQKEPAIEFAQEVVKTILANDCDKYPSFYNDTIVLLQQKELLIKDSVINNLKAICQFSIKSKVVDYEYYLENFQIEILSNEELKKHPIYTVFSELVNANPYYKLSENDYLYFGFIHKSGNYNDFILNDPFFFVFRQIGDSFKIIVLADN